MRMAYFFPAVRLTVAESTAAAWGVVWSMTTWPLIHTFTVSSDTTTKVCAPVNWAWTEPVQRAEKLSAGMAGSGDPLVRQAKFRPGSVRVSAGVPENVVFVQYCAVRPVPVPVVPPACSATVSAMTVAMLELAVPDGVTSYPSPDAFQVTGAALPNSCAAVMAKLSCTVRCSGVPAAGQLYTIRYSLLPLRVTAPQVGSSTSPVYVAPYTASACPLVFSQVPIPRSWVAAADGITPVSSGPMLSSRLPSRPTMSSRSRVSCAVGFQVSYLVHPHRLPVVRHDSHGAPLTGEVGICASRSGVV